jgi:hypothetical protein
MKVYYVFHDLIQRTISSELRPSLLKLIKESLMILLIFNEIIKL